jgi:prepilin peptidase CpaA
VRLDVFLMNAALYLFLAACLVACVTDARTRRIPNALTFGALGIALVFAAFHGPLAFGEAFGVELAVMAIGSIALALGWLGGGDIKLLAAGAATIGFPHFFFVLIYVALAGGLFAAVTAFRDGRLRTVLTHVVHSVAAKSAIVADPLARRVPYALAICAGTAYYAASESIAPWLQLVR